MTITTIGIDLAKNSFQLHGVDRTGRTVLRQKLSRSRFLAFFADLPACTIGMEACGGAHHWARELTRLGHTVRLMQRPAAKPSNGRACASSRSKAKSSNAS
jgi:transposase